VPPLISQLAPTQYADHAFATHAAYLQGIGHRIAALENSRLLPLAQFDAAESP